MNLVINEIIKIIFLRYSKYFFSIRKKEKALSFDRWPYHLSPNTPPPLFITMMIKGGGGDWVMNGVGRSVNFLKYPWIVPESLETDTDFVFGELRVCSPLPAAETSLTRLTGGPATGDSCFRFISMKSINTGKVKKNKIKLWTRY